MKGKLTIILKGPQACGKTTVHDILTALTPIFKRLGICFEIIELQT